MGEAPDIASPKSKTWKNVGIRAVTAIGLLAFCMAPFYFGGWVWAGLVALFGGRMMWEWVSMSDAKPTRLAFILPILGVIIAIIYMVQGFSLYALIITAITAIATALERARRGGMLWAGLGFLYIVIPCLLIVMLRGNETGFVTDGFKKLIFIIFIVAAADVGAYFGGSYFKGPKLSPKLSPNKTWSGFFSGLVFAALFGGAIGALIGLGFVSGLILAIPIMILSVFGDLLESGLKRVLEVKDTGDLLPGHGGLLDRLDSLMLAVTGAAIILHIFPAIWPL